MQVGRARARPTFFLVPAFYPPDPPDPPDLL